MKKILLLVSFLLVIVLGILFFPRTVENGIVISKTSDSLSIMIDGKTKLFKTNVSYPKLTVVSFNYNLLKVYNFKILTPLTDRIMIKADNYYDLETLGKANLATKVSYYSIDKNNNIVYTDNKSVVVGKSNVKYFKNKKGELKTFLVLPMDYSTMRVGISDTSFASVFHNKIQLKTEASAKLYSKRENLSINLPKNSILSVEKDGSSIKLTVNNNPISLNDRVYISGEALNVQNIKRGYVPFNPTYSGVLEFNSTDNGLTMINEVGMEDYLKKVVPSEMPSTGGIEALKCQAIAARTYAISDMLSNRFAYLGFYVDDSTRSQVYNNIETQTLSTQAVDSTKGIILTYKGVPIDAKYYSTSSGTGESYSNIWFRSDGTSDSRPYLTESSYLKSNRELPTTEADWLVFYKDTSLTAIDSDYPYFRWRIEYSIKGITTMLNKTLKSLSEGSTSASYIKILVGSKSVKELPELKELQDIKIIKRGNAGIAVEVSFIFSNATVNVRGDSYIRSSIKCTEQYTNEPTSVIRLTGSPQTNLGSMPSSFFSAEKTDNKITLYGGGFGHGAGMSQYGAVELSKEGFKYADILNTYYKGVTLDKIY